MATAYSTPVASQILDLVEKSACLFPRSASKSLMLSYWCLWGHMSYPQSIPVLGAVRLGIGRFWSHATLGSLVESALQKPH